MSVAFLPSDPQVTFKCVTCKGDMGANPARTCRYCRRAVHHLDTCSEFCDTDLSADPGDYGGKRLCNLCAASTSPLIQKLRAECRDVHGLSLLPAVESAGSGRAPTPKPKNKEAKPAKDVRLAGLWACVR
jgi:hypothetical protein